MREDVYEQSACCQPACTPANIAESYGICTASAVFACASCPQAWQIELTELFVAVLRNFFFENAFHVVRSVLAPEANL